MKTAHQIRFEANTQLCWTPDDGWFRMDADGECWWDLGDERWTRSSPKDRDDMPPCER